MQLLHDFQNIERIIPVLTKDRLENDAEHSYTLAMLAWYLIDSLGLALNKDIVLKYALIHDLVEVHAGDTYIFTKDKNYKNTKKEREKEAQQKLKIDFPLFKDLHILLEQYEEQKDEESQFIYALDKIITVMTIYLDSNHREAFWKKTTFLLNNLLSTKKLKFDHIQK